MEYQKQLQGEIQTRLALIEHLKQVPEGEEDKAYEVNTVLAMKAMDRLQQLLMIPSVGCDGQTAFPKKEDVT